MNKKMNLNKFGEILNKSGFVESMNYKDDFVPNILYKYSSLLDDRFIDHINKNKVKLNSLSENKLWVSNYKEFNDPFEFKMITLDKERLIKNK